MVKRAGGAHSTVSSTVGTRADPQAAKLLFVEAAGAFSDGEFGQAEAALDRHLQMDPGSWPGLCLKALIAGRTHREAMAERLWGQLLAANPSYADGYCQLGLLCEAQRRFDEAQRYFQRALQLAPDNFTGHLGLGMVLQRQGLHQRALQSYQKAARIHPASAQPCFNMGVVCQEGGDFEGAIALFAKALSIEPHHPSAHSNLLYCQHFTNKVTQQARYEQAVLFGRALESRVAAKPEQVREADARLRIGFVSADFRQHPVGYFLETVLDALAARPVELIAFSNAAQQDALTARIKPHFGQWHQVDGLSDAALTQKIRDDRIDILIDLSGHTAGNRLPVFAARAAPIQVSWLGYFATTGLSRMDHVLADPYCVPAGEERYFTEKVWRLPHTRMCFTPPADAPAVAALPVASCRPFTYGCFQDLTKIDDGVLTAWARILQLQPHTRLRLQSVRLGHAEVRNSFAGRLTRFDIPLDRVQLLGPVSRSDYLAAYAGIDLVLDTFPYPGGTTTVEALWMGVPTLTLTSPGMLGRQGDSLLSNAGLEEWICEDVEAYVAKAVSWANPSSDIRQRLNELRTGLRARVQASPLFDAGGFASRFEAAMRGMWRDCHGNKVPDTAPE